MRIATMIVRTLFGLLFVMQGLNGFIHFLPMPPQEGVMAEVMKTFGDMEYMFPLIFGTQFVSGVLLLTNMFAPLGLVLLAPVILNIVCIHLFLEPKGLPLAIVVLVAEVFLAYAYRAKYSPLFRAK